MGRINLQSLIDEVLGMAKDSQNIRKKKESDVQPSWYGGNKDEEQYWKDIRGRNTQMEVGGMQNAGQMDVARENNTGQLARQTLMEDTKRIDDARDYNLNLYKEKVNENVGRFNAQTLRKESDWKINQPQKGVLGDQLTAATAILEDMNSTDEDKKMARDFVFGSFKQPATQQQSGTQRNIIAPPDVTKKGDYFTKDTPVQSPVKEANSMEFASDEVLKKRKLMDRNKKVEEDMFGKPKRSSFLPW